MARLLERLRPEHFASMFATLMEKLTGWKIGEILNLDGKTIRAAVGAAMQKFARSEAAERQVHIVSLFSTMHGIFLAQLKTAKSVNEVKAAQELLQFIDIRDATITADAMHLTTRTFEIIEEQGAHAVVTVKKQFPSMDKAAEKTFRSTKPVMAIKTRERKGGVTESRLYEVFQALPCRIPTVKSFIRVTRTNVSHSGPTRTKTTTTRYVSTHPPERGKFIAECIRKRWHIENRGHYVLDVAFDEDRSRVRTNHSAENSARMRHIVFNLLAVADNPEGYSFKTKRNVAAADENYLREVLRLPA
jgi:predicted transposase YbfD/YdcC